MANLFSDSLSTIKLSDVEQFLNLQGPESSRPIEGPRLDFKKDLPQDIGRDVAALANTYGGILLVGVQTHKAERNVPISLPGTDLGDDPRARITDRILATVHPRPDFEIQPMKAADKAKSVAVIRVQEGTFPPYEHAQGATVGISVRIEDSSRLATLREIEALLKKRELAGRSAQQTVHQYLGVSDFFCSIEDFEQPTKLHRDPQFQELQLVPPHSFETQA